MGIIRYQSHNGYIASVLEEEDLVDVIAGNSGVLSRCCSIDKEVMRGEVLAQVLDPYDATVISEVLSPTDGIVFFANTEPLAYENSTVFRIIRRLHE